MVKTYSSTSENNSQNKLKYKKPIKKPCPICGSIHGNNYWYCDDAIFVHCSYCGLWRQDPQPSFDSLVSRYGKDYLDYETQNQLAYRKIALQSLCEAGLDVNNSCLENTTNIDNEKNKKSILDIGCATAALLALFKENGWNTRGVELSKEMSLYAKETFGVDVFNGTLEEASFPDSSFDVITATHLIEHLNEPSQFLFEVNRILKNNGSLYLITPNADSFQANLMEKEWRSVIRDHLYLFSVKTLSIMLQDTGFKVDYVGTWGGWPSGMKPTFIKKAVDKWAKRNNCGDVMIICATKKIIGE